MRELFSIRGDTLWVHDGESLSNHIVRESDFYEAEILDYLKTLTIKKGLILDIGANIGNHTIYFYRYLPHTHIHAFEPILKNYEVLTKNCEGLEDITTYPLAIGNTFGTVRLSLDRQNWGVGSISPEGDIEAKILPLDFFSFKNVSLIKIDVENYEPAVLVGASKTIRLNKPLILIEDNFNTYGELLPEYELIKGWEVYKTYLYKWRK